MIEFAAGGDYLSPAGADVEQESNPTRVSELTTEEYVKMSLWNCC